MLLLVVIILILFAVGGSPTWGYHTYGWGPSGLLGVIVVILLIWLLFGGRV
jgi:hypothetical protein